jgi:hypothetical protein
MPTTTKRTALEAYMAAHADALALIERIHEAIENHDDAPAPEQIHWGHVGDMVEIRRELQAISDRLFLEGEYAPRAK